MKFYTIAITILLSGCSINVDKTIYWNSIGKERSLICKDKETAVKMVRFSNNERSIIGQSLKIRNMNKSNDCLIVESNSVFKTGIIHKFPLTLEFPESYRGVKKEIQEITYNNNNYWLIETKK